MIPAEHSQTALCLRLRRERERRQIALASISANTKISASLFEALERGDVSRWPAGIYRRSFVRAYALAIGLDPEEVAREFAEQFPDPTEPPPAVDPPPAAPAAIVERQAALAPGRSIVRLKVAETITTFVPGALLTGMRRRLVAVACDGGVVFALALGIFLVCDRFWLPLGVTMIGYYLGGILILGNTPGVCLVAPQSAGDTHYNRSPDEPHPHWRVGVPAR